MAKDMEGRIRNINPLKVEERVDLKIEYIENDTTSLELVERSWYA